VRAPNCYMDVATDVSPGRGPESRLWVAGADFGPAFVGFAVEGSRCIMDILLYVIAAALIVVGLVGALGLTLDVLAGALGAKRVGASKQAVWGALVAR
jgi:hypothetical protein